MRKNSERGNKMKKALKIILIVLLVLVLLAGIGVAIGYFYIRGTIDQVNHVEIDENEIVVNDTVAEPIEEIRNIAILGIDSREDDYGKGNRSDCIIIAHINQKTKEIKLVSVYRDTYLEITGRGLDKVTHAYSYGGPTLALSTLNTNLDLNMKEFVAVNFEAVKEMVDDVGGITLEIDSDEVKHVPGITAPGTYHLNGEQALAYSRIRYAAGGDYKRTERMRTVIMAIFDTVKTKSIPELTKIAGQILPKINTNIDTNEIISLLPQVATYKITETIGWPYNTKGKTINGVWYGPPITLESNVTRLHQEVFGETDYVPSEKVKEISNQIIKKTGYQ